MRTKPLLVLAVLVLGMLASACGGAASTPTPAAGQTVRVALILGESANDMTWNYDAFQSITRVVDRLPNAELLGVAEFVAEADGESAMRDYADRGANLIIAMSFGYWEAGQRVCADYPGLTVVYPGGDDTVISACEGTFYPKTYESTYLIGMLAALMTETNHVGYIVSNPIPPLLAETNSFIQGVRDTDPNVQVDVIVTGSWYDPPREREAAQAMIDGGVDFIAFELNATTVIDAAKEAGILVAPPFVDQRYLAPNSVAVSSLWNWDSYFEQLINEVGAGTWQSGVLLWGIREGMADISEFGPMVPADVAEQVMAKRQAIIDGTFEVPYVIDRNLWEQ
jgi:basic membrane lipoprotein Med (substrate-binding protein (PBP1-ABC) superfamily)